MKCEHEWSFSLEHGFIECSKCYSIKPPNGLSWNLDKND